MIAVENSLVGALHASKIYGLNTLLSIDSQNHLVDCLCAQRIHNTEQGTRYTLTSQGSEGSGINETPGSLVER